MDNIVSLPTAIKSRPIHEVPEDFNPVEGLYLNNEECYEADVAFSNCRSLLRLLQERYQDKAMVPDDRNNPEDWQDVANIATVVQSELKKIGDILGK